MTFELSSAVIGALILVLTLIVCYMALLLYKDPDAQAGAETFMGRTMYRPACGNKWLSERRASCGGLTRGAMPAIDTIADCGLRRNPQCCQRSPDGRLTGGAYTHTPT